MKDRHYAHLPTSFEHPKCELNRKKSKFERYGLVSPVRVPQAELSRERYSIEPTEEVPRIVASTGRTSLRQFRSG